MEISCWITDDKRVSIKAPTPSEAELKNLTAAIDDARGGQSQDDQVLWRLDRGLSSATRTVARSVMGLGAVAVMTLLMALVVVPSTTRGAVAVAALVAATASSVVVVEAWRRDVAMVIRGSGVLRRQSWGGVSEVDLRSFVRVTVGDGQEQAN